MTSCRCFQRTAAAGLLCAIAALGQARYDLVLKGGHVIDPKNGVDRVADVAIRGGRVAAVEPNLPATTANKVIDVTGLYTPGLVDIHVHVFWGTNTGSQPIETIVCSRTRQRSVPASPMVVTRGPRAGVISRTF